MGSTKDRTWRVHPDPETGLVDPGEVYAAFQDAATIVLRLGGGIAAVPERFQLESGEWVTRAVNFQWTSFVPPVQPPHQAPLEEGPLPGIDEEALASLEGEEPFEEQEPEPAEAEPAVVLE